MENSILLVDDDKSIIELFFNILKPHGYNISTAESGHEALKLLKTNTYQLILLDLKMPGLSGTETLREIRKKNTTVPVYIITAFADAYFEELKKIREDNIDFELLHKPISNTDLLIVVESVLKKK